jgi:hypothetical protein
MPHSLHPSPAFAGAGLLRPYSKHFRNGRLEHEPSPFPVVDIVKASDPFKVFARRVRQVQETGDE